MKVGLVSVLIGILGLSFNAHAGFVHASSPVFGVGSITYDSNQNLNWLSPNATIGMSYNQVNGMLTTDSKVVSFVTYLNVWLSQQVASMYHDGIEDNRSFTYSRFRFAASRLLAMFRR